MAMNTTPMAAPIHRSQLAYRPQLLVWSRIAATSWPGSWIEPCARRSSRPLMLQVPGITLIRPRYTATYQIIP